MLFDTRHRLQVHVKQTNEVYPCVAGESLLKGMLILGRKGIPVGCVNGGCGVCKVRILSGKIQHLGPISRAHVSVAEEALGCTLACRAAPMTAVQLEVLGKLEKPFHRDRPQAGVPNFTPPLLSTKER